MYLRGLERHVLEFVHIILGDAPGHFRGNTDRLETGYEGQAFNLELRFDTPFQSAEGEGGAVWRAADNKEAVVLENNGLVRGT